MEKGAKGGGSGMRVCVLAHKDMRALAVARPARARKRNSSLARPWTLEGYRVLEITWPPGGSRHKGSVGL